MMKLSAIVNKLKKHKGEYQAIADEIGITYFELYNLISGRVKSPKWHVMNALQKWALK